MGLNSGRLHDAVTQGELNTVEAQLSAMDTVLSDLTFNANWASGTPSADAATDTITLVGHGFLDNQPVEFDAGTGALPAGISAYNFDTKGGEYYFVINKTDNTFQISLTRAGAAVDITSSGTAGWRVRKAFSPVLENPFTLTNTTYKRIKIVVDGSVVSGNTASISQPFYISFFSANRQVFRAGTQWGNIADVGFLSETMTSINKYNFLTTIYEMDIVGEDCLLSKRSYVLHSSDKSTGALSSDTLQAAFVRFTSITKILIASNAPDYMGLRNGTRVVIYGRN